MDRRTWAGVAAIIAVALLATLAIVLTSLRFTETESQRDARAASAGAVAPVAAALRSAMDAATSGTAAGARQVSFADAASIGVPGVAAAEARDSGEAVLLDAGSGSVVAATYDTPTVPESVTERRAHVTGIRLSALDLAATLNRLRPPRGGISIAGPDRTVVSLPGPRPRRHASYSVTLGADPAPDWTLTVRTATPAPSATTWFAALAMLLLGLGAAGWFAIRDGRLRRGKRELLRLEEASTATAGLATVAQHSLDLADLLPALTVELADALHLEGLSLSTPSQDGERLSFSWGVSPADVPASSRLPASLRAGETICLNLARAGRSVARLRVVAGRDLDAHDVTALGAATDVLTSAISNAEAFAQQRDLVERMKSVDELKTVFLATASHELRTPVGAITGYAQLLAGSWDSLSPEEGQMYAAKVDSNARRLAALVDDLLDFSRLERGADYAASNTAIDLGDVVSSYLDDRIDLAPEHEVVHDAPQGFAVLGSQQAVERVVSNLVGNAEKYSPGGTVIRVTVKERAGRVELAVDDQGPGVPPAERDQIFSRFFRGHGDAVVSTRGVGLGLAIVSEFAATMDGEVSVTASDLGGARFLVSYPLVPTTRNSVRGAADVHA